MCAQELARLVVKILQLQDALQSAMRPAAAAAAVMRHVAPSNRSFVTTTLVL